MATLITARLLLLGADPKQLEAELVGKRELAAALGVDVPNDWPPEFYDADAVRYSLDYLASNPDDADWGFYYIVLRAEAGGREKLVGAGGFKGAPNDNGEVELGYSIIESQRRHGYASEAVRSWTEFAFADARTKTLIGQTIPSLVPSIGVLEKTGFVFDGSGHDPHAPEGEEVLRYVLTRERWERSGTSPTGR